MVNEFILNPILSEEEQEIVLASKGKPIMELKKLDVANAITELVADAFIVLNQQRMKEGDRIAMEEKIVGDLYDKFKYYSLEEVRKAFWLGSRGALKTRPEDAIYMSVKTVYEWLVNYRTMVKQKAMKKQIEFMERTKQPIEMTQDQLEEKRRLWEGMAVKDVKEAFKIYLEKGIINDPVGSVYIYMNNRNYIKLSPKKKQEIFLTVLGDYIKSLFREDGKVKGNDRFERNENRRIIEKYRTAETEMEKMTDPEFKKLVEMTCQQVAIAQTFDGIKEMGMTIEEYLELNGINGTAD